MAIFNEGDIVVNDLQSYSFNGRTSTITVTNIDIPMFALFVNKEFAGKNNTVPVVINRLSFSYSKDAVNDKEVSAQFNIYLNPEFSVYNVANSFTAVEDGVSVCSYSNLAITDRVTGGRNVYNSYTRVGGFTVNENIELQPGDLIVVTGRRMATNPDIILDCNVSWYENF